MLNSNYICRKATPRDSIALIAKYIHLTDPYIYPAITPNPTDEEWVELISRCAVNKDNIYSMFVYDSKNGIWNKEDNTQALAFCKHKDDLYYIDGKDNTMKSVEGTLIYNYTERDTEKDFDWYVESGPIGYSSPNNKYVGRINLRITLELGTNVGFFIQYDSCGEWEHKFSMSGTGTRTFSIPIIPKRCDHFKYKITGNGGCKIHSVTKTIEEGSDS